MLKNKRILVAGGAGFIGSHICEAYIAQGATVVCVDNLCTGRQENIAELLGNPRFSFYAADICESLPKQLEAQRYDIILNLASPASPQNIRSLP